jgi:hypothetical protein
MLLRIQNTLNTKQIAIYYLEWKHKNNILMHIYNTLTRCV